MTQKRAAIGRTYEFPRPAVTVDVAAFRPEGRGSDLRLELLLIRRDLPPFAGDWALPGGFVRENEDLPAAAARELMEEAGLGRVPLYQVEAVGTPGRDPRGHVVTVLYAALCRSEGPPRAGGDASAAAWLPLNELPPLAFDHGRLLASALEYLRSRVRTTPILLGLLPETFTLAELQALTEATLGEELDVRNFRRRILDAGWVVPTGKYRREGAHRPARLFRGKPAR